MDTTALRVLTEEEAVALGLVCERIVPGSAAVGAVDYVDRVAYAMPASELRSLRRAIIELARAIADDDLAASAGTPGFARLRSLIVEAYYGDYAHAGYEGQTGWGAIGFEPPQATRLAKDWRFLDERTR